MAKKKSNSDTTDWMRAISDMGKKEREISNILSPNKGEIRYIVDYAKSILEKAINIEMASSLGHEKVIDFEKSQQIIDWQKEQLERDIKYLQLMLSSEE